jgi:YD repeat-containing protein
MFNSRTMERMTATGDTVAPWLDDDQLRDWKALVALVTTLPAAIDAQLKQDAGINAFEYHVLAGLADAPRHTLPMSDLASATRGSLSRLSHAVARLERSGWIERFACTEAGRRTSARLTDAGLAKLQDAAPGHVREARRLVVDALTPEQLAALGDAARRIVAGTAPDLTRALDDACGEAC